MIDQFWNRIEYTIIIPIGTEKILWCKWRSCRPFLDQRNGCYWKLIGSGITREATNQDTTGTWISIFHSNGGGCFLWPQQKKPSKGWMMRNSIEKSIAIPQVNCGISLPHNTAHGQWFLLLLIAHLSLRHTSFPILVGCILGYLL